MVLTRTIAVLVVGMAFSSEALADRTTTKEALDRLEELIELRLDDGTLRRPELLPTLVVSTQARYEDSEGWYAAEALSVLVTAFGAKDLRACEACMRPRVFAGEGELVHSAGPIGLDEIIRLDAMARGTAEPARTAIWLDEHAKGVSIKIVELSTARIVFAENVDPTLRESQDTADLMRMTEELERRARGDSLTHAFVDIVMVPNQHVSMDWTDQWGSTNENFTGLSLSLFEPVLGLGLVYYRVIDVFRIAGVPIAPQIGFKVLMSLPTAIINSISSEDTDDVIDSLLTGLLVVRVPIGRSNYGIIASIGLGLAGLQDGIDPQFGIGISLLNISLLPVIP